MIDIHCHILPSVDDGPGGIEESLLMCETAFKDGIRTVVATPHHLNGVYNNDRETVLENTGRFNAILKKKGIGLELLPGSDVRMDAELTAALDRNGVMTLNDGGKFLLLEPPDFIVPEQLKEFVFNLKLKGITPVITHPERNKELMRETGSLYDLIMEGALIQITAGSITGDFGPGIRKNALTLLDLDMVHVVATDAHGSNNRPPVLSGAVKAIESVKGKEEASKTVIETPRIILDGGTPSLREPLRKKRTFFSFFGKGG